MDGIEALRFLSAVNFAFWVGAGFITVPLMWRTDWKKFPLLGLLFIVALAQIGTATAFVHAAETATVARHGWALFDVLITRVLGIATALAYAGVLYHVVTHHRSY